MKKLLVLSIVILLITLLITGCFEKKTDENNSSGETEIIASTSDETEDMYFVSYNNGGGAVEYKNKIYYIEYNNNDYTRDAIGTNFFKNQEATNSQRYINVINEKGNIENLFKVTDLDNIYIVDDRFYLQRSTGMLYSVDMKGENGLDFARGIYVGFDPKNHAIYYTNANATGNIVEINTKTMSISDNYDFDNKYIGNGYTYLGVVDGQIYYYTIDSSSDEVIMCKHNVKDNKNEVVTKVKVSRTNEEKELINLSNDEDLYEVLDGYVLKDNKYFIVYGKIEGTMLNFFYGKLIMFDIENEKIEFIENDNVSGMLGIIDNKLIYSNSASLENAKGSIKSYDLATGEVETISKQGYTINADLTYDIFGNLLISDDLASEIASKYKDFDLKLLVSEEVAEKYPDAAGYNMYDVSVGNYKMVGDSLFYTVISSKLNPAGFIGWRPSYIRKALDVYEYNVKTKKTLYVYSIINNVYEKMEDKIEEVIQSGDVFESGDFIIEEPLPAVEETLKEDEMILTINVNSIWQEEFDVRVEEVGGMIIGKRIEYEGHHLKSDGDIKVKVLKEVGAMLTVYVDNSLQSQMRIEEDM